MDNNDVNLAIKVQLINQERQMWINTRELMIIRHRVAKRLDNKEGMTAAEKELTNCETALDELDKMLAEMTAKKPE